MGNRQFVAQTSINANPLARAYLSGKGHKNLGENQGTNNSRHEAITTETTHESASYKKWDFLKKQTVVTFSVLNKKADALIGKIINCSMDYETDKPTYIEIVVQYYPTDPDVKYMKLTYHEFGSKKTPGWVQTEKGLELDYTKPIFFIKNSEFKQTKEAA